MAHVRGCGERQEVARDVKGPGVHRPVVGRWLHLVRFRILLGQVVLDRRVQARVGLLEAFSDASVGGLDRRVLDVLRDEDATWSEVLVA